MEGKSGMAPPGDHGMKKMTHMTFYWGSDGYVLFEGWPGTSTGMYVLSLVVTFALALLVEFFSRCRLIRNEPSSVAGGLAQTLVYALRMGLDYLVMLALMSFNGGIFMATILGHMVGFLILGSGVFRKSESQPQPLNMKTTNPC